MTTCACACAPPARRIFWPEPAARPSAPAASTARAPPTQPTDLQGRCCRPVVTFTARRRKQPLKSRAAALRMAGDRAPARGASACASPGRRRRCTGHGGCRRPAAPGGCRSRPGTTQPPWARAQGIGATAPGIERDTAAVVAGCSATPVRRHVGVRWFPAERRVLAGRLPENRLVLDERHSLARGA